MATMQEQARALGDPTRHEIFRYVADAADPVGVAELTDHFGLNHNAIRQHLAKLVEAELVIEGKAAITGRGRPRLTYSLNLAVDSRWGVAGPYERLAMLMSEIIRTGDTPVEVGRRAGQRLPRATSSSAPGDPVDPVAELTEQMARQGFAPITTRRGKRVELLLDACPFVSTAVADPDTVCSLHLGIALGIADSTGGLVVDELVPKDPRRARCRLRCHVEPHQAA